MPFLPQFPTLYGLFSQVLKQVQVLTFWLNFISKENTLVQNLTYMYCPVICYEICENWNHLTDIMRMDNFSSFFTINVGDSTQDRIPLRLYSCGSREGIDSNYFFSKEKTTFILTSSVWDKLQRFSKRGHFLNYSQKVYSIRISKFFQNVKEFEAEEETNFC